MIHKREAGQKYERLAEQYLEKQGLISLSRNYQIRGGEIDLIMKEGDMLVFVEVRFRKSRSHGGAEASLGSAKQRKLIRTAEHYLLRFGNNPPPCRFDFIGISGESGPSEINWIKNAITC